MVISLRQLVGGGGGLLPWREQWVAPSNAITLRIDSGEAPVLPGLTSPAGAVQLPDVEPAGASSVPDAAA